jgi:multidrug efflux pump subunit AcrB
MSVLAWFVKNPVAANLLMGLILLAGAVGLFTVEKEVFPRFSHQRIEITAFYPGAGPEEIETRLCIPIEEAIHDLPGVVRLETTAGTNWRLEEACVIQVRAAEGYDLQVLMGAMRARIQNIPHLPEGIDRIDVNEAHPEGDDGVIWVALYGATDELTLKHLGEQIQADLERIPGVDQAINYGHIPDEIAIEIPAENLRRHGLTLSDVAAAVRRSSLDRPGGSLKTRDGDVILRTRGQAQDAATLGETTLFSRSDGTQLRLKAIADIRYGLAERAFAWHHDGFPAQGWEIHARRDEVSVARRVKAYIAGMAPRLPEGLHLKTWHDDSQSFDERVQTLLENGLQGLGLVLLVLTLFLNLRVAFWAAVGLFTALVGSLAGMWLAGISLNMLSLFGFVLALGLLVDDAIVVGDSVQRHQNADYPSAGPENPVVSGLDAVAAPVILSVVTTIVAFLPGLFLDGWAKALLGPICAVMILALSVSLVEALCILPAHLAAPPRPTSGPLARLHRSVTLSLEALVRRLYAPLLGYALRLPSLTLSIFAAAILIAVAMVLAGHVRQAIRADVPKDTITVFLDVPAGTPFATTQALSARVEHAYGQLREALQAHLPVGAASPLSGLETLIFEHWSGFWAELAPDARRHFSVETLAHEWRRYIGDIGNAKVDFLYREGDTSYDLEFAVSAPHPETVAAAVKALTGKLAEFPGVFDVTTSQSQGKPQRNLALRPEAERLGLRLEDIAEQVRQAYLGEVVQRFQRGPEQVKIVARLPLAERRSPDDLDRFPIRLPTGGEAPLSMLAEWQWLSKDGSLTRLNRQRVVWVRGRLDRQGPNRNDANAIYDALNAGFIEELKGRFPGVRIESGQARLEEEAVLWSLGRNALLALALIYGLLAVSFRSYGLPFLFLFTVPVAWTGGVFALFGLGLPLSAESLVGMIGASGVAVNDSLVLLHAVRTRRKEAETLSFTDCLREICLSRVRPILLAFLTTFMGLVPLLFETSAQAQFLIPMAATLAAGLLFGMTATLLLIPAALLLLESRGGSLDERTDGSDANVPSPHRSPDEVQRNPG